MVTVQLPERKCSAANQGLEPPPVSKGRCLIRGTARTCSGETQDLLFEMKFFLNVLKTFGTELLIALLSFFTGVVTARLLGPKDQGVLSLAIAVPITLTFISNLGLAQANIYFIGRKRGSLVDITANSFAVALSIGLVIIIAIYLFQGYVLKTVLRGLDSASLMLVSCVVPLMLVDRYLLSILEGLNQFGLFNLRRLLTPLLTLIGIAFAVGVLGQGLKGAVIVQAAVVVTTTAWLVIVFNKRIAPLTLGFNKELVRDSLTYGIKAYVQNLAIHLLYHADLYLLALFRSAEEVACYAIAMSLVRVIWYVPDSVGLVLFPRLARMTGSSGQRFTAVVCRWTLLITAGAALALAAVGGLLVPSLYGTAYSGAVRPMLILLPGAVVITVYKVVVRDFISRDSQKVPILTAVLGLAVNVVLNLVLIPKLGTAGSALAATLSYSVTTGVLLLSFLAESRGRWRDVVLVQHSDWPVGAGEARRWLARAGLLKKGQASSEQAMIARTESSLIGE